MTKATDTETVNLVVERFSIKTEQFSTDKHDALMSAARLAETILFVDIFGAVFYDTVASWGKKTVEYPSPKRVDTSDSCYKSNWHIPPYEYETGIRWKPFDCMQQFDVKVESRNTGAVYQGVVKLIAYVWADSEMRLGCLLDIVHRNEKQIEIAETGSVAVHMDNNSMDSIDNAHLINWSGGWEVSGLNFSTDEKAYKSSQIISFSPIDLRERIRDCAYRDR